MRYRPSEVLDPAAMALGIQSASSGSVRRKGFSAYPWCFCCLADQIDQSANSVPTVLALAAESVGMDDEHAVIRHSFPCQAYETPSNVLGQREGVFRVKTDLNGRGDLIDILTARSGCPDKMFLYFVLAD